MSALGVFPRKNASGSFPPYCCSVVGPVYCLLQIRPPLCRGKYILVNTWYIGLLAVRVWETSKFRNLTLGSSLSRFSGSLGGVERPRRNDYRLFRTGNCKALRCLPLSSSGRLFTGSTVSTNARIIESLRRHLLRLRRHNNMYRNPPFWLHMYQTKI